MPVGMFAPTYGNVYGTGATLIVATTNGASLLPTNYQAPVGAVAFILESESGNTQNLRWALGLAANASIGMLMEPGRDSGVIPFNATLSICGQTFVASTFNLTWITGS